MTITQMNLTRGQFVRLDRLLEQIVHVHATLSSYLMKRTIIGIAMLMRSVLPR
jgi:hypothetical protein